MYWCDFMKVSSASALFHDLICLLLKSMNEGMKHVRSDHVICLVSSALIGESSIVKQVKAIAWITQKPENRNRFFVYEWMKKLNFTPISYYIECSKNKNKEDEEMEGKKDDDRKPIMFLALSLFFSQRELYHPCQLQIQANFK